jgi:hypothetical protein
VDGRNIGPKRIEDLIPHARFRRDEGENVNHG